jgi:hypothetical protein
MKLVTAQIFRQRNSKILDHSFESLDSSSMWCTQIIRVYGSGFWDETESHTSRNSAKDAGSR